ncbi:MAG: SDR family NAD(P)-dependent oxidoreductase [Candidatus Omnitrophica bacterium]|nr:SDR family NAD(P)-dependent oxidoreductase [Candidatus Omnitrophota bacterium]MBD3268931.1 SDR family NAD(P)-dependent oxidoreductase [Candidatus Omnitrophota bacterium]
MEPYSKNILITGATGFIGKALAEELIRLGNYNIFCLIRDARKAESLKGKGACLITADLRYYESLKALDNYSLDTVVHCAALVKNCSFKTLYPLNVKGIDNLCRWMKKSGVKNLIHISSVAVISGNDNIPLGEDLPLKAVNNYGFSKIEAEKVVKRYRSPDFNVTILRPPMVYGRGEPHLTGTIISLMRRRILFLPGGGMNKFHLVYLKNLISAIIFILENQRCRNETFIVADNEVLSSKEVFSYMARALNLPPPRAVPSFIEPLILRIPFLGGHLKRLARDREYAIEKIKSFGFSPPYPAKDSIFQSLK